MRRRTFIASIGCAVSGWSLTAHAQQRVPRIGYLATDSAEADKIYLDAFEEGLREIGYISGKSIEIEFRYSGARDDLLPELAREFIRLKVDVIVAVNRAQYAARAVTSAVPIVVPLGGDFVSTGMAESLSHPSGNVTGQSMFLSELLIKRAAMLKEIKPEMKSVGVLFPQKLPTLSIYLQAIGAPIRALGLELKSIEISDLKDCDLVLSTGSGASIDGLVIFDQVEFISKVGASAIAGAAARRSLPLASDHLSIRTATGYLVGLGVDYLAMYRCTAVFVDKILKGAKPGNIPIERVTKFITIFNLKTAATLGVDIPPTLLAAADEVIE